MPSTADIIREASSLPVEERALVVDSLLRSNRSPEKRSLRGSARDSRYDV
jgi:hypothetical protein